TGEQADAITCDRIVLFVNYLQLEWRPQRAEFEDPEPHRLAILLHELGIPSVDAGGDLALRGIDVGDVGERLGQPDRGKAGGRLANYRDGHRLALVHVDRLRDAQS